MIYLQRDNERKNRKKYRRIFVIVGLLGIVVLFNIYIPQFLSPVVHAVGVPVAESRSVTSGGIQGFFALLKSKRALILENQALREKLALYTTLEAERNFLTQENTTLKALLGRSEPQPYEVIASILSKPGYSLYDTLIIDVGESEGIKVGDIVLADRSVIVGEVSAVFAHSSKVITYSSPEYKNDVFIGEKAIQATALGKGGGNFEVKLPRNTEVKEGDMVTLSRFPGKIFGTISSIKISSSDTFEQILFRGVVDINHLKYVTVEKQ